MAEYASLSKYGIALETTSGTLVTPSLGIPQESLITFDLGHEWANTPKLQGVPYGVTNEYVNIGLMPKVDGFSHNLQPHLLNLLLASMHGGPGDESANVFSIGIADAVTGNAYPAAGADYTYGSTARPWTLSLKHETGAAGSVNHTLSGCVCNSLTLTFPSGGGPVKMAYSLVGMTGTSNTAAGGTYTLETSGQDPISSAFTFATGVYGATSTFYPEGDVIVTLTPQIEVLKRGEDRPRSIIISKWGGTFSFGYPWDSSSEVDDLYTAYYSGQHFELSITNDSTPDTIGEYYFRFRGRALTNPTIEGDGLLRERAEFQICGAPSVLPYQIDYFEGTVF